MTMLATLGRGAQRVAQLVEREFPMPQLLAPRSAGIDISDASIKWLAFSSGEGGMRIESYGEEPLQEGVIVSGAIKDVAALSMALSRVKLRMHGITHAHAALPEEPAYIFQMRVPRDTPRDQVRKLIEFEFEGRVPIPPQAAVFDFDVIESADDEEEIGVVVFPRELAEAYVEAFTGAGLTLLSLEAEPRSIARAICTHETGIVSLLADFGRARTGFAVLKNGIPIFSSTVEVGGSAVDRAVAQMMHLSGQELTDFKNDVGLTADRHTNTAGFEAVIHAVSALSDEIARHYHFWDTRRDEHGDRVTPVSQVVLVGGSSNLKGLTDYIAGRVQAPTHRGDVWSNVAGLDTATVPIDRRTSLQYATAIGLALRAFI